MTVISSGVPAAQQELGVVIRRSGNLIELSNQGGEVPIDLRRVLEPVLSYDHRKFLYGIDRKAHDGGTRKIEVTHKQLYRYDQYGRMVLGFGLLDRVLDTLEEAKVPVVRYVVKQPENHPRPDRYVAEKERIKYHFNYKPRQEECIDEVIKSDCGVVWAVTGFGKMVMIAMVCLAFPYAKIDIVTKRLRLVNKLKQFLTKYIPNVGQVDGSKRKKGRVTVYSVSSLHHSSYDADIVLCDEGHELLANEYSAAVARYRHARMYTFTASPKGRSDGADIRLESLFGRPIFHLPYPEAVKLGLVVPIRVEWSDVFLDFNPCADLEDVQKKRWGLWQNEGRNMVVAAKALSFDDDEQVLVTVETIEHAIHLRKFLPGFTLVYDSMEPREFRGYKQSGLLPEDEPIMTPLRKEMLRKEFETGTLKKAIATGVWHVGIDPVQLAAVVRAEGSGSETMDIQIPGRVSRTHQAGGKEVGIVCDFKDQFDFGLANKAKGRARNYKLMEWEQVVDPGDLKAVLALGSTA